MLITKKEYFIVIDGLEVEDVAEYENIAQIAGDKYHIGRRRNAKSKN